MARNLIFKGFRQVNGLADGFDKSNFESGYMYFVRTNENKEDGYIQFNGKSYGRTSQQVKGNPWSSAAINLLITILNEAVYSSDQSGNIALLFDELSKSHTDEGGTDSGDTEPDNPTPQPTIYTITKNLTNCTISNSASSIKEGQSYMATVSANSGFENLSVTCKMGGENVSVSNGVISIANVSGNIVITASATAIQTPEEPTAQYISFADPKVKAILLGSSQINADLDDEISYEEAASCFGFGRLFYGKDIDKFHELRFFTNIVFLDNEFTNATIQEVTLPNITTLPSSMFSACNSLKVVNLPNTLTSLGKNLFADCKALETITLPDNLPMISFGMFLRCSALNYIEIPASVQSIGNYAFYSSAKKIKMLGSVPPTLDNKMAFSDSAIVYVPDDSVNAYKTAEVWSTMASKIKPYSEM